MEQNSSLQYGSTGTDNNSSRVEKLLQKSRESLASGKPNDALNTVVDAIRIVHGADNIMKILDNAKYAAKISQIRAEKEAEIRNQGNELAKARKACEELVQRPSILADNCDGSEEILQQAFEDGSSVICTRCHGLVSRVRWPAHCEFWCPAIPTDEVD